MVRHAIRDEEAGGPGLGVLGTRKRTRRGADGTIITRPTKRQARAAMVETSRVTAQVSTAVAATTAFLSGAAFSTDSARSSDGSGLSSHGSQSGGNTTCFTQPPSMDESSYSIQDHNMNRAAVSPPTSAHNSCSSIALDDARIDASNAVDASDPLIAPMLPGGPYEPYAEPIPGQFDAADGSWQHHDNGLHLDYEDVFDLDTGLQSLFSFPVHYYCYVVLFFLADV